MLRRAINSGAASAQRRSNVIDNDGINSESIHQVKTSLISNNGARSALQCCGNELSAVHMRPRNSRIQITANDRPRIERYAADTNGTITDHASAGNLVHNLTE